MLSSRCLLFFFFISFVEILHGQVGRVGINTTSPSALLHVKDSSVLFSGPLIPPEFPGPAPVTGPGIRMMWYPQKAAFRGGQAVGQEWKTDSIGGGSFAYGTNVRATGFYTLAMGNNAKADATSAIAIGTSVRSTANSSIAIGLQCGSFAFASTAMGHNNTASGFASIALGSETEATGNRSTSMGYSTRASGVRSTAMGEFSTASGTRSIAIGFATKAFGENSLATGLVTYSVGRNSVSLGELSRSQGDISFAQGLETVARSYQSVVFGAYNDTTAASTTTWNESDPLFIIGNGSGSSDRRNALTILKNGNLGIGTINPHKLLHVRNGSSGATAHNNAHLVVESNSHAGINILTPISSESGLYFGIPGSNSSGGFAYNGLLGMAIRTANTNQVFLTTDGDMGLGDLTPNAKMHIADGPVGGPYHSDSDLIVEDNGPTFLQFSSPVGNEAAIFSGNDLSSIRSGMSFRPDSTLQFRTGGNNTRMAISNTGNVGINTTSPAARLDVNGTTILGVNGTAITDIIKLTVSMDVANVPATSSITQNFTVANCNINSSVLISPQSALPNGLIIAYARVSVAGNVESKFTNTTGADINPASMNYFITVIR